ncbi:MAG: putative monovalent cation/H+ antiporter subunit A [Bacteroidales bacterium]|nr:putative monovalent cation/H+ antiporter subunit A [Bacteroidales bacterium]
MLTIILYGFAAAIVSPFIHKLLPKLSGALLSLVPLSIFVWLLMFVGPVSQGEALLIENTWFPSFDINLNFLVDGLSLTFALIISGIGAIIVFYASGYLKGHRKLGRFYGYLLFFMTSMLGVVLSDNILALFVFWELTSISSYLLIGFNHEAERSRYAALQALLVTGGGGLAMMAGFLLMGSVGGSFSITALLNQSDAITGSSLYLAIVILVLLGAFTKSAQWPFHIWLPNAMEAPTPVSAYLHSATMVKAGVFLIARLYPVLSGPDIWHILLMSFGGVTMLMSAAMAIGQNDLKRILAYTTVSALGIMVFLLGMGGKYAVTGAITFLVVHALYKGGLFLVAGAVDHETGTRDIRKLSGLKQYLPLVAIGAVLAALSYSGIPPFLGFIAKELIYEGAVHATANAGLLTAAAVLTNMFLVATAIMVGVKPFFGKFIEPPKHPHKAPVTLWIGPIILGVLGLFFGLFPSVIDNTLIGSGVMAIYKNSSATLALWHGFNSILLLSLVTLLGGIGLYFVSFQVKKFPSLWAALEKVGPEAWYNFLLQGLLSYAPKQTAFFQNGRLRNYFYFILLFFGGMVILSLVKYQLFGTITLSLNDVYFYEVLIVIVMLAAALLAIISKTVLGAVAAIGVVGFGVAILFAMLSAPDLALTQFSIETLTVILLVLVAYKVPEFTRYSTQKIRIKDAVISVFSGALITVITLIVLANPSGTKISDYFLENSYVLAHGKNVVNVILVDFRALDTMGEITVLSLAAIGVYTLVKFRPGKS